MGIRDSILFSNTAKTTATETAQGIRELNQIARIEENSNRPQPLGSLLSSAQRITSRNISRLPKQSSLPWQAEAWEMTNMVGEQRFIVSTLAKRVGQARLYVGVVGGDDTGAPIPVEKGSREDVIEQIGNNSAQRAQLLERLAFNLLVAGDGWLIGTPKAGAVAQPVAISPLMVDDADLAFDVAFSDLEFRVYSIDEVELDKHNNIVRLPSTSGDFVEWNPDQILMSRVWNPDPRFWRDATSPTRAVLPVLRELVGLTMAVSAQIDSRLAGAGMLIMPESAIRAIASTSQPAGDLEMDDVDVFIEALVEAMITPISDRDNASAVAPLVVQVPDDVADKIRHLSFSSPFDQEAQNLRDEAIRRLALGQEAPPEVLLGASGMNHWGAWLVREDTVTTHIEPPLALICDALTTQFLWPVLESFGLPEDQVRKYVIWYNVGHLIQRPNRIQDAGELHTRGVISDDVLRREAGYGDEDAPPPSDANSLVLDMLLQDPTLAANPGVASLLNAVSSLLNGDEVVESTPVVGSDLEGQDLPDTDGESAEPPTPME